MRNRSPREFEAQLGLVAQDICAGKDTDVSFYEFMEQLSDEESVVALLNQQVNAIDSNYRVELADSIYVGTQVMGRAIYCKRLDQRTNQERFFYLGAYRVGMRFSERASDEEIKSRLAFREEAERQRQQEKAAEQDVKGLCLKIHQRLQAHLSAADAVARKDALYHLRSFRPDDPNPQRSIFEVALACRALGISLDDLLAE